jgi:hypothetical protein
LEWGNQKCQHTDATNTAIYAQKTAFKNQSELFHLNKKNKFNQSALD